MHRRLRRVCRGPRANSHSSNTKLPKVYYKPHTKMFKQRHRLTPMHSLKNLLSHFISKLFLDMHMTHPVQTCPQRVCTILKESKHIQTIPKRLLMQHLNNDGYCAAIYFYWAFSCISIEKRNLFILHIHLLFKQFWNSWVV